MYLHAYAHLMYTQTQTGRIGYIRYVHVYTCRTVARKFGMKLNLAVWQSVFTTARLSLPIFLIIMYGDPVLSHQI